MIAAVVTATIAWSGLHQDVARLATPEESAAAAAAFAPNIPPTHGDWRVLTSTPDGATAIDVAHIEIRDSRRTLWIAKAGPMTAAPPGAYALARLELDCAAGAARPRWFEMRAASGSTIYGFQPSEDFKTFEANSGGAMIAATVCHDGVPDGAGFSTHQAFAASITVSP